MLAATAKGTELGMYGDLKLTANAGLTRDNVAELVFNALTKAVTVEYNDTFNIYFNTGSTWANGVKFDYKQTLGYKNFDLVYMNDEDDFGRPSTVWGTGSLANVSLDDEGNIPDSYKASLTTTSSSAWPTPLPTPTLPRSLPRPCTTMWAALPLRTMTGPFTPTARPMSTPSTATTCMTTVPD